MHLRDKSSTGVYERAAKPEESFTRVRKNDGDKSTVREVHVRD